MGGPRASAQRQIHAGKVCAECRRILPPRTDGRSTGQRLCPRCYERFLIPVYLFFQHYTGWHVSFAEADCKTFLPWQGTFRTTAPLFAIVGRTYQPAAALQELQHHLDTWGRGSLQLRLTAEQHRRLRQPRRAQGRTR